MDSAGVGSSHHHLEPALAPYTTQMLRYSSRVVEPTQPQALLWYRFEDSGIIAPEVLRPAPTKVWISSIKG